MAKFDLMKILPAKYIVENGIKTGKINPKVPIVETSSGTFALGLGIVCAEMKIPFCIISDPAIDTSLERRLNQLGGEVQILSEALKAENPQTIRLNALRDYMHAHPEVFWTRQYDNPDNQKAYNQFGHYLTDRLGSDLNLVCSVGSGGSSCGTIEAIRESNPAARLVGVDTFGSVLFGLKNAKRTLRGLGNSLLPKNLQHDYFDEVHWVSAHDAFFHTRQLHAQKALFCGATSGAAYQVADWLSEKNKHELFVFIAPDAGYRYQDTIYDDFWLQKNGMNLPSTLAPHEVSHPNQANESWNFIRWNRSEYHEILGVHHE